MVSLSLLKLLELNGFGKIDRDLFWEKMGLGEDGIYITDTGGSQDRGSRPSLTYQIYSRAGNDVEAYQQLQAVTDFFKESFAVCELPPVPPITDYGYKNVTIMPPSSITSVGQDINGRVIYSITGQIYYGERAYVSPPVVGDYLITEDEEAILTENNRLIEREL